MISFGFHYLRPGFLRIVLGGELAHLSCSEFLQFDGADVPAVASSLVEEPDGQSSHGCSGEASGS